MPTNWNWKQNLIPWGKCGVSLCVFLVKQMWLGCALALGRGILNPVPATQLSFWNIFLQPALKLGGWRKKNLRAAFEGENQCIEEELSSTPAIPPLKCFPLATFILSWHIWVWVHESADINYPSTPRKLWFPHNCIRIPPQRWDLTTGL